MNSIQRTIFAVIAMIAMPSVAMASFDGNYKGTAPTTGGTRDFCKGKTPITASVASGAISIRVPKSEGGAANVRGKVSNDGSFNAKGDRFTYSGKISGKKISGKWKAKYCNGPFSMNR